MILMGNSMQSFTATTVGTRVPAALALRGASNLPRQGATFLPQGQHRQIAKGEELFAEGDAADYFYRVISGTVRICKILSDGRRQIEAFHLRGDLFGLESGRTHRFTAEAVDDVAILAFRRGQLTSLVHDNRDFGDQIMAATLASLDRAHDHMVLLGRKTAQEKVASFLLEMAQRLSQPDRFDLPMQRADIADHLGLTIETVSRTLTQMVRDGLISLAAMGRTIVLGDKEALRALDA
jgi:CRP/FNR family nitrogen fixation transcriptional regulator